MFCGAGMGESKERSLDLWLDVMAQGRVGPLALYHLFGAGLAVAHLAFQDQAYHCWTLTVGLMGHVL